VLCRRAVTPLVLEMQWGSSGDWTAATGGYQSLQEGQVGKPRRGGCALHKGMTWKHGALPWDG